MNKNYPLNGLYDGVGAAIRSYTFRNTFEKSAVAT
jgi:hypothetical protein